MIFKRIVPDEYYLFSSVGHTLAVGWSIVMALAVDNCSGHLCSKLQQILYHHGQHFNNVP